MDHNTHESRKVADVLQCTFKIPDFQRRYRWTPDHIIQLLEDINQFSLESDERSVYYLQPLVVRKGEDSYIVIDGQQRLTTITMIIDELNKRYTQDFQLPYEKIQSIRSSTIDDWHKNQGSKAIRTWMGEHKDNLNRFEQALLYQTCFIWHELDETEDQIQAFLRLNAGKIPFTREDRIKALFLRSFDASPQVETYQNQIIYEWVVMENALQDEKLWGFLHPEVSYENRVGLLFDITTYPDTTSVYEFFKEKLINLPKEEYPATVLSRLKECWSPVKETFDQIMSWYSNATYYHYIGYLVATSGKERSTLKELLSEVQKRPTDEFLLFLKDQIKNKLNISAKALRADDVYDAQKRALRPTFLLFNVESIVKSGNADERFDFSKYHDDQWDVEHIRSQADFNDELDEALAKSLAPSVVEYFGDTPKDEEEERLYAAARSVRGKESQGDPILEAFMAILKEDQFKTLFDQIPLKHGLGNLALLNAGINRGYKDAFFAFKRKKILEESKKGVFVPLCTRLVFQKAYSTRPKNLIEWTAQDAEDYREHLIKTIEEFLQQER